MAAVAFSKVTGTAGARASLQGVFFVIAWWPGSVFWSGMMFVNVAQVLTTLKVHDLWAVGDGYLRFTRGVFHAQCV